MKTKRLMILVSLLAMFAACSRNDSHVDFPSRSAETAFRAKYPGASSVEWESAGVFQKVEFVLNSTDYEAWYSVSGVWLQTEYALAYTDVPLAVREYITNNINYPIESWKPQRSAEVLERLNYPLWYEVELKNGNEEVSIWADAEAYGHYTVTEDLDRDELPRSINNFLASKYTNSWVTEGVELSDGSYVVNLLDGNEVKQVHFNPLSEWTYTGWPVSVADLPAAVQIVLGGEAYKDYSVKSVEFQQYPNEGYYHIILENTSLPGSRTIWVNIDSQGNIH